MKPRERVIKALNHEETDRPPLRDPDNAVKVITDYTAQRAQEVYRKAEELLDSLKIRK